jgi:hypothetical protein
MQQEAGAAVPELWMQFSRSSSRDIVGVRKRILEQKGISNG